MKEMESAYHRPGREVYRDGNSQALERADRNDAFGRQRATGGDLRPGVVRLSRAVEGRG